MPCLCEEGAAPCAWCDKPAKASGRPLANEAGELIGRLCPECSATAGEMLADLRDEQEGASR